MIKLLKSGLLWQLTAGFVIGTVGMLALHPAGASVPAPATAISTSNSVR